MRTAYLEELYNLASRDNRVYAVISDNGAIVYDKFRASFPDQFINAGISEANMVGMAAGMAERGKIPFAYTIGAFLAYRAYEFILNDVCLMNKNVKMVGIGAGCSYSLLGSSHHSIFDISALRVMPNLTFLSPASPLEVKECVKAAYALDGPVYIRLGTNREKEIYSGECEFKMGRGVEIMDGSDVTLVATGSIVFDVLQVAGQLRKQGISARVININTIKPFDNDIIIKACHETGAICTIEEHCIDGGLGTIVSETIADNRLNVDFMRIGFTGFANGYGTHTEVKAMNGLGIDKMTDDISEFVRNKR